MNRKLEVSSLRLQSKPEFGQPRMLIRAPSQRPVELALALIDWQVVDAGKTIGHQAILVEFQFSLP